MDPNNNLNQDPPPTPTSPIQSQNLKENVKPPGKINKKWIFFALIAALVMLAGAVGGYFVLNQSKSPTPTPIPTTAPTGSDEQVVCTQDAKECPDGSFVSREGPNCEFAPCPGSDSQISSTLDKTYTSSEHKWQIDYPSSLEVNTYPATQIGSSGIGQVIVFSKLGSTQSEGTELYDGLSMTVGVVKKDPNDSIKVAADKITKPQDPEISTRSELKEISINSLSGYEATVTGLGEFRIIILENPNNSSQAYYISSIAVGPGASEATYKKIISDMLASLRTI